MGKTGESNEMMPTDESSRIILYMTDDGKSQVSLMSRDGRIWLNQKQMAELFAVTKMNISLRIANILKGKELDESVVKFFFTTAADGKQYKVTTVVTSWRQTGSSRKCRTTSSMPRRDTLRPKS